MTMMRRSDAFNNALTALEGQENAYPEVKAGYIRVLEEEHGEAHEQFWRYRTEVGIPDRRPSQKHARKPA